MRNIIKAVGRHLADRARAILPEVGQTLQDKAAQGATEVSNALFTGHAYSPYTADTAHRAKYQNQERSQGIERD